jgi:Uma2 family endonuclease
MADAARKRATYQDVLDAPSNVVAEVIDGVLHTSPRPGIPHARASSRLGDVLGGAFDRGASGPGGWIILDEPELHLGEGPDILVPDLAGWRRESMPELPEGAFVTRRPDWVCEVVSVSTEHIDRADKVPVYAREGAAHVWLVDPAVKTLEVFRLDGKTYRLIHTWRDDATCRAEPFDAIQLSLAALWER